MGVDTSINYATDQYHEFLFSFLPEYDLEDAPRRLVRDFDRLSQGSLGIDKLDALIRPEIDSTRNLDSECKTNLLIVTSTPRLEIGEKGKMSKQEIE